MDKEVEKRLKEFEEISDIKLSPQTIVAIRVDGKNFSKVTQTLMKPFDELFSAVMENTMQTVAKEIDGCFYAYTQSDEITFLVENQREQTPYFNNRIQKIVSVVASKTTLMFYKNFLVLAMQYQDAVAEFNKDNATEEQLQQYDVINKRVEDIWEVLNNDIAFDARCFTIPEDEMWNEIYYRQQNCYINAVNSMCSAYLTPEQVEGKKIRARLQMLEEAGHPITEIDEKYKLGIEYGKNEEGEFITQVAVKLEYDDVR